ncbi:hypothetical protein BGZ76_002754 [Entomortierella beljakovae]|nr:hypothetical protein BGZ76_002754 [Entomortierella beljakovae]
MRLPRRTVENLAYLLSFYFKNKDLNCNPRTLLHAFGSLTKHTDLDDDKDVGHDVVDGDEEKGMVNKKRNTKRMSQEDLEGLDENSDYDNMNRCVQG